MIGEIVNLILSNKLVQLIFWSFPDSTKIGILSVIYAYLTVEVLMEKTTSKEIKVLLSFLLALYIYIAILIIGLLCNSTAGLFYLSSPPEIMNHSRTGFLIGFLFLFIFLFIFLLCGKLPKRTQMKIFFRKISKLFRRIGSGHSVFIVFVTLSSFFASRWASIRLFLKRYYTPLYSAGLAIWALFFFCFWWKEKDRRKYSFLLGIILGILLARALYENISLKEIPNKISLSCYMHKGESFIDCDKIVHINIKNFANISYIFPSRKWIAFEEPISLTSCWYYIENNNQILKKKEAIIYKYKENGKITKKYCIFNFTKQLPKEFEFWSDYNTEIQKDSSNPGGIDIRIKNNETFWIGDFLKVKYNREKVGESSYLYCFSTSVPIHWEVKWYVVGGSENTTISCPDSKNCVRGCSSQNSYCSIGKVERFCVLMNVTNAEKE